MSLDDPLTRARPVTRPRRKDAALNNERLVQAAREVFARRGLSATLEDIAKHAGVGIGTIYRNFANKRELVETLYVEALDSVLAGARASLEVEDPWDALVTFFQNTAEHQARDRGLCELFIGHEGFGLPEQIAGELAGAVMRLFERANLAGVLRAGASFTDTWPIFAMLYAVYGLSEESPELWRRYLALLLDALRAGDRSALPVPAPDAAAFARVLAPPDL
jgi:AcrR family transcriptional regulator